MHGEEGRAMAAVETILRSSFDLLLVRDNRRAYEAEEGILTLARPTGSWRAWKLIMFNHRHGPRALSTCNFLGVTFLLLIVAGSYDVSADLNSEFVKGKSEFHFHPEEPRGLQSNRKVFPRRSMVIFPTCKRESLDRCATAIFPDDKISMHRINTKTLLNK